MNQIQHDINLHLRTAAGHERAAIDALKAGEDAYEMKMVSAGAATYAAFVLAVKAAPDYQGRKIDDAAIERIYKSTKPRRWWDAHLSKVKGAGKNPREWASRLILWHLDVDSARARRAGQALKDANRRKALKDKQDRAAHGARAPQVQRSDATHAKHAAAVTAAAQTAALVGRELPSLERIAPEQHHTAQDCAGEVNRIKVALGRLKTGAQFNEAVELLKAVARDLEKLA